jgi:16S rRNA G1207 methylase RsmC
MLSGEVTLGIRVIIVRGKAPREINRDKKLIKQNLHFTLKKTPKFVKESKIKAIRTGTLITIRAQHNLFSYGKRDN